MVSYFAVEGGWECSLTNVNALKIQLGRHYRHEVDTSMDLIVLVWIRSKFMNSLTVLRVHTVEWSWSMQTGFLFFYEMLQKDTCTPTANGC